MLSFQLGNKRNCTDLGVASPRNRVLCVYYWLLLGSNGQERGSAKQRMYGKRYITVCVVCRDNSLHQLGRARVLRHWSSSNRSFSVSQISESNDR